MSEETITTENQYRFNIKQTSKGSLYCEATIRAETLEELKKKLEEVKKLIKENSTVGGD